MYNTLRKILILILIIVSGFITFRLWPLKSSDFTINWDDAALQEKQEFLHSIRKASPTDTLPNIVLILVDDLGLFDMSFYGGDKVETPHIDGLGQSGAAFNQAYVAAPMCSPSRAAILTGRYPQRFGFDFQMHDRYLKNRLEYLGFRFFISTDTWQPKPMENVPRKTDIERQGLPPQEISIADLLKARGYATALIGKWHTGSHPANLPVNFGFDYQYGFFDAHSMYAHEGTYGITDQRIKNDFTDQYNWKRGRKNTTGIFRNNESIEEKEHLTDAITRESISFIRQHKEQSFFLFAAYNAPHSELFWQRGNTRAIRSGDWKVIWNAEMGDTLLFDIGKDPNELHDLFPFKKDLTTDLISIHNYWSETLDKPLWPSVVHFREEVNGRWIYFDN